MRKLILLAGALLVGGVLLGLAACESAARQDAPGALPVARPNLAPRVNASTYVAHGHLLEQQGNLEQAVVQYRQALQLTPDLPAARSRLGITLNKLERHHEASEEFRAAIVYQPLAAHLHNNLGFSLYLEGDYVEAERVLAQAVELQPAFRRAQMNHGLVLARLERYDEALAAFSLAGSAADAHFNVAMMQVDAGHFADAAHSLERALQANPEFAPARQQLREVARLAAAEEQARAVAPVSDRCSAAAVAAADEARGGGEGPPQTVGEAELEPVLAALPNEGVKLAADVDAAPLEALAAAPEDDSDSSLDCGSILAEIDAYLAAAADALPPASRAFAAVDASELVALFDELVAALLADAPWYEGTLCRLRETLGEVE